MQIKSKGTRPLTTGKFGTLAELHAKAAECKALGRSQEHCARVCGVSRATIQRIYREV